MTQNTEKRGPETFIDEVLGRMAEGESLRSICADLKDFGCPSASWFCAKVLDDEEFAKRYARTRVLQCEARADMIVEEARKCRIGVKTKVTKEGATETTEGDNVERSKLAVDALKWTLAKLHPKQYGDKIQAEVSGPDGGAIEFKWRDPQTPTQPTPNGSGH